MVYDLKKELAFYRQYHAEPHNVLIHAIFVPTILFTTLLLASNISVPVSILAKAEFIPPAFYPYINLGVVSGLGYGIFYTILDTEFGLPTIPVLLTSTLAFSRIVRSASGTTANKWSAIIMTVAWIAQFIGHGVFEKRAPALLDNLVQALVMAPFFIIFEAAHYFNYRTEILDEVDELIKPELEAFRATQAAKKLKKN